MKIRGMILFLIILLYVACSRIDYQGSIAVTRHLWRLERVDTVFRDGKYRPVAYWYGEKDRIYYVDLDEEFPYPYAIGVNHNNFDRK